MAIFAKIANFAKIAIFAKIVNLQGATFGVQFKSPAAGDFSPLSPFSPLHAFLDISEVSVDVVAQKSERASEKRREERKRDPASIFTNTSIHSLSRHDEKPFLVLK